MKEIEDENDNDQDCDNSHCNPLFHTSNDTSAIIKAKINTKYFSTGGKKAEIVRIAYASYSTLINHRIQHDKWYVITSLSSQKKTVVLIKGLPSIKDENMYIHPIIMQLLDYSSLITVSLIEEEIPVNRQKYSLQEVDIINNLPLGLKVTLIKMPTNKHHSSLPSIQEEVNGNQVISLGQIIHMVNMDHVNCDVYTGIFTHKNIAQFNFYRVVEIEYELYDCLMNENNHISRERASKDNALNAYFIGGKGITSFEIEKLNYAINDSFPLPKHLFKCISNHLVNANDKPKAFSSIKRCYSTPYKMIKEAIENDLTSIALIGSHQSGIGYLLKCISDKWGFIFFKKDMDHFKTGEELLTYIKKKELSFPCLLLFSNLEQAKWLNNNDNDIINRLKQILSIDRRRNKSNDKANHIIYVFHFQYESSIPSHTNQLFQRLIDIKHLSLQNKLALLNVGLDNFINHGNVLLRNNKLLLLNLTQVFKEVAKSRPSFNSSMEKIAISLSIKDIKTVIKTFFILLSNNKLRLPADQILLEVLKGVKRQKLNQDEALINSIPEIKWEDIGGLEEVKEEINDIINLPMKYPHLFDDVSMKMKRGLLLHGPPGTGKTLIAKAIANECSMNFISVKGPELLNMYVGESEKNIRNIFSKAKNNSPCVIFFDEIDSLCPRKAKHSDQSNIMDRIVSQFVIEIDEKNANKEPIIMIAATNRPDLLDPSLLRPGRFDKMVYVGLPASSEEKMKILKVHTNKFQLAEDVVLISIVNQMPENYSGADIYQICSKSFIFAFKEQLTSSNINAHDKALFEKNFQVKQEHFLKSISLTAPSISVKELEQYKKKLIE